MTREHQQLQESDTRIYSAALVQDELALMAWDRIKLPLAPTDIRSLLVEHISNMLAILASDVAYEELWGRVRVTVNRALDASEKNG